MLILMRNINKSLIFGKEGDIKVTILEIKRGQVKLGIEAPADVPVHREEVYLRIRNRVLAE